MIFVTVAILAGLALLASIGVVAFLPGWADRTALLDTCSTAFKLGFGGIIGLIGGKAA